MKKRVVPYLFLFPSLLGVLIFAIIPFMDIVKRSVYNSANVEFVGMRNFVEIIQNKYFCLAVRNTVLFILISLPLVMFVSLVLAMLLLKLGKFGQILKSAYLLPLAIPVAALTLFWKMLFTKNSFWILVLLFLWKNMGLSVLLWVIGISSVPSEQLEAAKLEGAYGYHLFIKIILPNIKESVYTLMLLLLMYSFKIYRDSFLLAGDYPDRGMYMLQNIMNNWFRNFDLGKMAASGVLCAMAIVLLVAPLSKRFCQ